MKKCTLLIATFCIISIAPAQVIRAYLNNQVAETGKFQGFSTVQMFDQCPPSSDSCMNWLTDLEPNVVRFPSGGQSKFTHLTTGPGYGFDLDEIEDYYSNFFGCGEAGVDCGPGSKYESAVSPWVTLFEAQDSLPPGDAYIDDFIQIINTLQTRLGYTIDVIFCMNIITATAEENKAALDLLTTNGVHVAGVEMGNETYGQDNSFNNFDSYLSYIQNPSGSIGDQDYIGMMRKYYPDIKIGVCAAPPASVDFQPGAGISYMIAPTGKRNKYDNWNIAIGNQWDTTRIIDYPSPHTVPQFDAAIVHFYYDDRFWSDCSDQFLSDFGLFGGVCCPYTFLIPDLRLSGSFNCFETHADFFRDSVYQRVNDYYADKLQLNNPAHSNKKIWTTEWNILESDDAPETALFNNTLAHASLVFDWQNLSYQYNNSPSYNHGFQEYRTMHNFASVSYRNMITDKTDYETSSPGDTSDIRKRVFYDVAYLMRHISDQPVNTISVTTTLPGVKMYGYVDQTNQNVYIYYNNVGTLNTDQQFRINKIKFTNPIGCHAAIAYPVTNEYIKGKQLYSTAGVAYMYDIVPLYGLTDEISSEINGSLYNSYTTPKKLTLYKNSLGVIRIPIVCTGRLSEEIIPVSVYPNPANNYVNIDLGDADDYQSGYTIDLYDFMGKHILQVNANDEVYTLQRNNLPSGMYFYSVRFSDGSMYSGKFIFE